MIRADMILHQLQKRHTGGQVKDAFFTEVKNGSSWFNDNLLRLDAIAIKKSWKSPCITGYEVKIDRQDFLRDDKWPGYLKYCHRFSFTCPVGLILPDELPDEVGLIYYNPEKDYLTTKRKAAFRMIEIPWEMLYYLVLSRLDSDRHPFFSNRREYLQAWVRDKADRQELAYIVSSKMAELVKAAEDKAVKLERKEKEFEEELELLGRIRKILDAHGIRTYSWQLEGALKEALSRGMPPQMTETLERINRDVGNLIKAVGNGDCR